MAEIPDGPPARDAALPSADDDTLAAVQALWAASAALPGLLDRAPGASAARSPRGQPLTLPYGVVTCEPAAGKSLHLVKGNRKDVRRVVLAVYGTYAQARAALAAMQAAFHPGCALAYPSGARFCGWRVTHPGSLAKEQGDAAQKGGDEVWRAQLEAEAVSGRSDRPRGAT